MTSRLSLLAAVLTFAGSIAGFHLTVAAAGDGAVRPALTLADRAPVDEAPSNRIAGDGLCRKALRAEET